MTAAFLAGDYNRLRKRHLIYDLSCTFADRTAALGVEGEPLGIHTVCLCENLTDLIHNARVCRGRRSDGCPYGLLVDYNSVRMCFGEFISHQRAFPRTRNTCNCGQYALGNRHMDMLQVVTMGIFYFMPFGPRKRLFIYDSLLRNCFPGQCIGSR